MDLMKKLKIRFTIPLSDLSNPRTQPTKVLQYSLVKTVNNKINIKPFGRINDELLYQRLYNSKTDI